MGKKTSKIIASTAAVCLVLSSTPALAVESNNKLSGNDRIHTAIKMAEQSWGGAWKASKTAVLAPQSDKNLVDALTVSPLAYKLEAPILLSAKDGIDADTLKAMKDQGVTKVYIASGTGVISTKAESQLKEIGATVERLGGKDRYETASNILKAFEKNKGTADKLALVSDTSLADALSVSSIAAAKGMPIVLTSGNEKVASNFGEVIKAAKEVYAIGGNGVISDALVNQIKATRLGGANRYDTNAKVIENFAKSGLKFDTVYLANGANKHLVDSLTGSVVAAQTNSPIVLGLDSKNSAASALKGNTTKDSKFVELGGQVNADFVKDAEATVPKAPEKPENPTPEKPVEEKLAISTIEDYNNSANKVTVNFNRALTKDEQNEIVRGNRMVVYAANTSLSTATDNATEIDFAKDGKSATVTFKGLNIDTTTKYIVSVIDRDYNANTMSLANAVTSSNPTILGVTAGDVTVKATDNANQFMVKYPEKMNKTDITTIGNYSIIDTTNNSTATVLTSTVLPKTTNADNNEVKLTINNEVLVAGHTYSLKVSNVKTDAGKTLSENGNSFVTAGLPTQSREAAKPVAKTFRVINAKTIQVIYNKAISSTVADTSGVVIGGLAGKDSGNITAKAAGNVLTLTTANDVFQSSDLYNYTLTLPQSMVKDAFYLNAPSDAVNAQALTVQSAIKPISLTNAKFVQNEEKKDKADLVITFNQPVSLKQGSAVNKLAAGEIKLCQDTDESLNIADANVELYDKDSTGCSYIIKDVKTAFGNPGINFDEMNSSKDYTVSVAKGDVTTNSFDAITNNDYKVKFENNGTEQSFPGINVAAPAVDKLIMNSATEMKVQFKDKVNVANLNNSDVHVAGYYMDSDKNTATSTDVTGKNVNFKLESDGKTLTLTPADGYKFVTGKVATTGLKINTDIVEINDNLGNGNGITGPVNVANTSADITDNAAPVMLAASLDNASGNMKLTYSENVSVNAKDNNLYNITLNKNDGTVLKTINPTAIEDPTNNTVTLTTGITSSDKFDFDNSTVVYNVISSNANSYVKDANGNKEVAPETVTGFAKETVEASKPVVSDKTAPVATVNTKASNTAKSLSVDVQDATKIEIVSKDSTWVGATAGNISNKIVKITSETSATDGQKVEFTLTDASGNAATYTATYTAKTTSWAITK